MSLPARPPRPTLSDILTWETFFRHKLASFLAGLSVLLLTLGYLWCRDRTYESVSRVFVRLGREAVTVDPTAAASGQVLTISESQQREIQSAIDILESRGLIEQVVEKLGTDTILDYDKHPLSPTASEGGSEPQPVTDGRSSLLMMRVKAALGQTVSGVRSALVPLKLADPVNPRAKAIERVEEALKVNAEHESNVVSIQVKAESPVLAQRLSDVLLSSFQDRYLSAHRSPGAMEFFGEQSARIKEELDAKAAELSREKSSAGLASIQDQKEILANRLKDIEIARVQAISAHEASRAKVASMDRAIAATPERVITQEVTGLTNTSRDEMRARLYQVELDKAELASVYSEEHPLVKKAEEKIRQAQHVLGQEQVPSEVTRAVNASYEELRVARMLEESDVAGNSARLSELERQRGEVTAAIQQLNAQEVKILDLERDVNVLDGKYRRYVEGLEQARIDEALEQSRLSSVNVIQTPTFSSDPVDPSNSMVALAGMIVAFGAAVATSLGLELLRQDLSRPGDIERALSLPVLADVPLSREQHVVLS